MQMRTIASAAILLAAAGGAFLQTVRADGAQQEPRNVQVHTDKSLRELQGYMQGVAAQLGVRCDHCHNVADFSSDEKEHKRTARHFMRMVQEINQTYLPQAVGTEHQEVVCWNCHQGQAHPPEWPGPQGR